MESIKRLGKRLGAPVALLFILAGCAADIGTQYMNNLQQYGCARSGNTGQCLRPTSPHNEKADTAAGASRYHPSAINAGYAP